MLGNRNPKILVPYIENTIQYYKSNFKETNDYLLGFLKFRDM